MTLGMLGAVTTLAANDVAPAIWNAIPSWKKTFAGLTDEDYRHLAQFVARAYADGYVVQRYDDPGQISKPGPAQIEAEVRRLGAGIYSEAEISKAVSNFNTIADLGFVFTKTPSAPTATISLSGPLAANDGSIGAFFKAIAGGFAAYAPIMNAQQQAEVQRTQTKLDLIRQRTAAQATPPHQQFLSITPWVIGAAGVAVLGLVIYGVMRKK